jgi:hypothetical protein
MTRETTRPADGEDLRDQVRDLRALARNRPLIGQAQGVLMERYRLPDARSAFLLLKAASQRHNVRLRVVATAVLAAPRPARPGGPWFPGRVRTPPPRTAFLRAAGADPDNRSAGLEAVLARALETTGAGRGDLQLVDPALDVLELEKQRGFSDGFLDFFAHVGDEGTACAAARRTRRRITVTDVERDPIFEGRPSRLVMLDEGSRTVQSTPVLTRAGRCVGMVSTHGSRTGTGPTAGEREALDELARDAADWLEWYRRTVLLDALEHLHLLARTR